MKDQTVENVVVDDMHQRTFVVMAGRLLTDGELYRAIRQALLKRGSSQPVPGERLVINAGID